MVTANTTLSLWHQMMKLVIHIELNAKDTQLIVPRNWSNSALVIQSYIYNYFSTDAILTKLPVLDKGKKAKTPLLKTFFFFLKIIPYI